jgi:hypothetical protein
VEAIILAGTMLERLVMCMTETNKIAPTITVKQRTILDETV